MAKKGKPQRNARDIQTPASDRESSSPKPELPPITTGPVTTGSVTTGSVTTDPATTGSATIGPAITGSITTGPATTDATLKQEKKATRFARSPTRKGDFAPGEISDNYESNAESDVDSEDASDQDALIEHRPDDVGRWVKDLIAAKAAEHKDSAIQEYFITDGDSHDASYIEFFQKLNQEIRAANAEHSAFDLDNGIIKDDYYVHICHSWRLAYKEAKEKNNGDAA
ncbi:hypothetical protein N7486_001066 [Penicillium sp. IBT 16267x]|nr:hypothetical protein N7486_001066 [Penicillium sp. IBT 16267x]